MGYHLTRVQQIGVKLHADEDTVAVSGTTSMGAAAYSRELAEDSKHTVNALSYERGSRKASLSHSGKLLGPGLMEITWTQEMSGGGPLTADRASWYDPLLASGFVQAGILKVVTIDGSGTVGATSGGSKVFKPGDRIGDNATEGSATKTGIVVDHWFPASGNAEKLVYLPGTGAFSATDEIHNYSQPGLHSPCDSSPTDAGKRFVFQSNAPGVTPAVASVEQRTGGKLWRAIFARGDAKLMWEHGKPALIEFTFRGVWDRDTVANGSGAYTAAVVGSIPIPPKPLLVGEVGTPFRFDDYAPVMTKADLALGNTLTDRKTVSESGITVQGEKVGYMATVISNRRPVITVDPESVDNATYNFVGKWQKEQTFVYYQRTGSMNDAGSGAIAIRVPAAQFDNDSWSQSDREGIITEDPTILCTGSADDEITLDHYFVV